MRSESSSKLPRPAAVVADSQSILQQAVIFHRAGSLMEAEQLYREVLRTQPRDFNALHLLGVVHHQRGRHADALDQIDAALTVNSATADAHNNRGNVLVALKRFDEAVASYGRAIALKPDYAEAFVGRANALHELKKFEDALKSCEKALALKPDHAEACYNFGNSLAALKRFDEALVQYNRAIALNPNNGEVFNNRGGVLQELAQYDAALKDFDKAISLKPDYAEAFNNLGLALAALRRFDAALASYDRAIALKPDYFGAFNNRGATLLELKRFGLALKDLDKSIEIAPDFGNAYCNRADALKRLDRWEEALADYNRAIALGVDHQNLPAVRLHTAMHLCLWDGFAREAADILSAVAKGSCAPTPFSILPIPSTPIEQRKCAELFVADQWPALSPVLWRGERYAHDRIRVAYLSADLHDHATAHLAAGLFEHHDRSRFEMIALSFGPAQDSPMRRRLQQAFEHFIDVRAQSDEAIAEFVRRAEIDIAVDLKGFTQDCRPRIFAKRPAPVQVSYLGYPGTMGASYIDYLIADHFVIPLDQQAAYSEKIVYLPDCYQINDTRRNISETIPSRTEVGLPEQGFVFCCFNNNYKITPDVFDIWMRLLAHIEGSVLWLLEGNPSAPKNLRREAERRGVAPERLIFAPRALSRHALLQRTHHGERCAVGRIAAPHMRGNDIRKPGCRQPTSRRGAAGTRNTFARCVRSARVRARARPNAARGRHPEARARALDLSFVQHRTADPPSRGGLRRHVGERAARRFAGEHLDQRKVLSQRKPIRSSVRCWRTPRVLCWFC
jgi:protein O-GlcNAc transferase